MDVRIALWMLLTCVDINAKRNVSVQFTLQKGTVAYNISPTGLVVSTSSVVSCARRCLDDEDTCNCFVFNTSSNVCTLGQCLPLKVPIQPAPQNFYVKSVTLYCNQSVANFSLRTADSVGACVWVSTTEASYDDAKTSCKDLGANLYTIKVIEKKALMLDLMNGTNVPHWIGLDCLVKGCDFRWVDDNSMLNVTFQIFSDSGPSSCNTTEKCAAFHPKYYPVNDISCSRKERYICEQAPLTI
ncbi:uncharacterized protein LOC129923306 [Biomphalaria glabrata]|uniref:Uncharacterized protein LOC129923306 n=1 Tax=Biomphalaria glabrata TaxID=6526 RepID=A0A9W2Z3N7_BIOGL|nr:uncharacterized protein LOC129923306 [Biomphalaria glabrata]